ncbi:MAG: signal peptide peptidase SppA [Fusobacteriota bacterium]
MELAKKVLYFFKKIGMDLAKKLYSLALNIILILLFLLLIFKLAGNFGGSKDNLKPAANIDKGSVIVQLEFPNGIREEAYKNLPYNFGGFEDKSINLYKIIKSINSLSSDDTLILKLDKLFLTPVHREEVIRAIKKAKERGLKIYAYGNMINNNNYAFALLADELVMPPLNSTMFNIGGYYRNFSYYRELADTLGINFQVINIGDYKTYGERYTRNNMSDELKSEFKRIYDFKYNNMLKSIASERNLDSEILNNKILDGDFQSVSGIEAKKGKLIDKLKFYDDFLDEKNITNEDFISIEEYYTQKLYQRKISRKRIAVIYAQGPIKMERSPQESEEIIYNEISKKIETAANDSTIKGIVLRVNSPGGSALASQLILKSINEAQKRKPLYISMGDTAASGGYYLSSQADRIYANEMTVTGSIGVVILLPKIEGLIEKIGVKNEIIKKGENNGIFDLKRDLTVEELEKLTHGSKKIYEEFKKDVSVGRDLNIEYVEEIAQGKIWLGAEASNKGLVDEIGGLDETIKGLAKHLEISDYSVVEYKKEYNYGKYIRDNFFDIKTDRVLSNIISEYQEVENFSRKPLMLFPYEDFIRVQKNKNNIN